MQLKSQRVRAETNWLYLAVIAIFFASGFAALIYQIVWQRALFTIFGINVEAATVVIAGFLLGLGFGSLLGGSASRTRKVDLLMLFGLIEIVIGAAGVASLDVFSWVGTQTILLSSFGVTAATLALVILPTLLMGATLPLLTQYFVTRSRNVGSSVGILYCINTLGSTAACFASALWLMRSLGMHNSVKLAAVINFLVGFVSLYIGYGSRRKPIQFIEHGPHSARNADLCEQYRVRLAVAFLVALLMGYIALSYEIVWFRAFLIGTNRSQAFALILGAYLGGLAMGSCWIRRYFTYHSVRPRLPVILSILVLVMSVLAFAVLPIAARGAAWGGSAGFVLPMLLLVFAQTTISGMAFPLLCHMSFAADDYAGVHFSRLYMGNILGSAAGTVLTGFVLMDYLSTIQLTVFLSGLGAIAAAAIVWLTSTSRLTRAGFVCTAALVIIASPFVVTKLHSLFYERIIYKQDFNGIEFAHLVENKSGVIAVDSDAYHTVFGGGMYDGLIWIDLIEDRNLLLRPISVALFHSHPDKVLMIGLGTGAWAQIVANNPMVEKLTIIEINPGYLSIIAKYPIVNQLLKNPKVEIIIDDGRRWMTRNPDSKFDVIIENTTWYFRPNVTNLLSAEYLRLSGSRLRDGGILMYNTTYSDRAQLTACRIFPYAMREFNMMVASYEPLRLDHSCLRDMLEQYKVNDKLLFDLSLAKDRARLDEMMEWLDPSAQRQPARTAIMEDCQNIEARTESMSIITDDNMGEEWDQVTLSSLIGALHRLLTRLIKYEANNAYHSTMAM
jgi:spermidine synthase